MDASRSASASGAESSLAPPDIQYKRSASGTMKTEVGSSAFYSKRNIIPIDNGSSDVSEGAVGGGLASSSHKTSNAVVLGNVSGVQIKKMAPIYDGQIKFPKLKECAHFHYECVNFEHIQVTLSHENQENLHRHRSTSSSLSHSAMHPSDSEMYELNVCTSSCKKQWYLKRSYEELRVLDTQLHKCIYDRRYSHLPDLTDHVHEDSESVILDYFKRFSEISDSRINCGPVLSWFEMDNHGNRLVVSDGSDINTPAVGAAHVVKRYIAQAPDELTFEVGDMISVIDMPPGEESAWWRGKKGFEVGFFPADSVELIKDKELPSSVTSQIAETPAKPVLRKRGKLISFLRTFFTTRPPRSTLKRTGIVRERVFGCDLGEHLLNSGLDVPLVLKSCTHMIEEHGIVDGIYRLSGIQSNIQKLRNEFDEGKEPDLNTETYLQDIHSISSLLKMYFRDLPNPLFTYQLYDALSEAVQSEDEGGRLMRVYDVIQMLPPPHYRTAENLIRHLARIAEHSKETNMHCKNLAIVWAPNLLRSKELEAACTNAAALHGVGVQAIVTEYLINYSHFIFSDHLPPASETSLSRRVRPKSLVATTPTTKLLSLEEAQERAIGSTLPLTSTGAPIKQKYIEVGDGPHSIPNYHTVIEVSSKKKRMGKKDSAKLTGTFGRLFSKNRSQHMKITTKLSTDSTDQQLEIYHTEPTARTVHHSVDEDRMDETVKRRRLKAAKSAESLLSNTSSSSMSIRSNKHGESEAIDVPTVHSKVIHQRSISYDEKYHFTTPPNSGLADTLQHAPSDNVFASVSEDLPGHYSSSSNVDLTQEEVFVRHSLMPPPPPPRVRHAQSEPRQPVQQADDNLPTAYQDTGHNTPTTHQHASDITPTHQYTSQNTLTTHQSMSENTPTSHQQHTSNAASEMRASPPVLKPRRSKSRSKSPAPKPPAPLPPRTSSHHSSTLTELSSVTEPLSSITNSAESIDDLSHDTKMQENLEALATNVDEAVHKMQSRDSVYENQPRDSSETTDSIYLLDNVELYDNTMSHDFSRSHDSIHSSESQPCDPQLEHVTTEHEHTMVESQPCDPRLEHVTTEHEHTMVESQISSESQISVDNQYDFIQGESIDPEDEHVIVGEQHIYSSQSISISPDVVEEHRSTISDTDNVSTTISPMQEVLSSSVSPVNVATLVSPVSDKMLETFARDQITTDDSNVQVINAEVHSPISVDEQSLEDMVESEQDIDCAIVPYSEDTSDMEHEHARGVDIEKMFDSAVCDVDEPQNKNIVHQESLELNSAEDTLLIELDDPKPAADGISSDKDNSDVGVDSNRMVISPDLVRVKNLLAGEENCDDDLSDLEPELFTGSNHQLYASNADLAVHTETAPDTNAEDKSDQYNAQLNERFNIRPVGSIRLDKRFRLMPGLSQAADLRRSMEDGLDTPSTMDSCSIGSFNEHSQSLDSLLKSVNATDPMSNQRTESIHQDTSVPLFDSSGKVSEKKDEDLHDIMIVDHPKPAREEEANTTVDLGYVASETQDSLVQLSQTDAENESEIENAKEDTNVVLKHSETSVILDELVMLSPSAEEAVDPITMIAESDSGHAGETSIETEISMKQSQSMSVENLNVFSSQDNNFIEDSTTETVEIPAENFESSAFQNHEDLSFSHSFAKCDEATSYQRNVTEPLNIDTNIPDSYAYASLQQEKDRLHINTKDKVSDGDLTENSATQQIVVSPQGSSLYERRSPVKSPAGNLKIRSAPRDRSPCPEDDPYADKKTERKRNPAQRKKSVKELRSQFESGGDSPPAGVGEQPQGSFKPLVHKRKELKPVQHRVTSHFDTASSDECLSPQPLTDHVRSSSVSPLCPSSLHTSSDKQARATSLSPRLEPSESPATQVPVRETKSLSRKESFTEYRKMFEKAGSADSLGSSSSRLDFSRDSKESKENKNEVIVEADANNDETETASDPTVANLSQQSSVEHGSPKVVTEQTNFNERLKRFRNIEHRESGSASSSSKQSSIDTTESILVVSTTVKPTENTAPHKTHTVSLVTPQATASVEAAKPAAPVKFDPKYYKRSFSFKDYEKPEHKHAIEPPAVSVKPIIKTRDVKKEVNTDDDLEEPSVANRLKMFEAPAVSKVTTKPHIPHKATSASCTTTTSSTSTHYTSSSKATTSTSTVASVSGMHNTSPPMREEMSLQPKPPEEEEEEKVTAAVSPDEPVISGVKNLSQMFERCANSSSDNSSGNAPKQQCFAIL